jgi:hypothetical protein
VAPPAAEPERGPIQELLNPADLDRFQKETAEYKKEVQVLLQRIHRHRLNAADASRVSLINTFVRDSDRAAGRQDWRSAHELAERALALARELTGGK